MVCSTFLNEIGFKWYNRFLFNCAVRVWDADLSQYSALIVNWPS